MSKRFKKTKRDDQIIIDEKTGQLYVGNKDLRLLMLRPIDLIEFTEFAGTNAEDIILWVGKTIAQVKAEQALELAEQINAGWNFCPPGGEDRKSVLARSQRALQAAFDRWPGENILVVTHEGVIKSLVYHLSGRKFLPTEPPLLKSYQLHRLVHDRDGLRLEAANALALASTWLFKQEG